MSLNPEILRPLADYAPQTYRRVNPKPLRRLTSELLQLVGPEETPADAKRLVAEFVIGQVRSTAEDIHGISPEQFSAGILAKTGVVAPDITFFLGSGESLPIIELEGDPYVLDFDTGSGILPYTQWLQRGCAS